MEKITEMNVKMIVSSLLSRKSGNFELNEVVLIYMRDPVFRDETNIFYCNEKNERSKLSLAISETVLRVFIFV